MFQTHHQRILQALATSLGIWSLLVWVDVATGLHVRFGPFYALPVILCSWFLGRPWGIMAAMLSAGLWHGIQSQALPPSGPFFDRFLDLAMGLLAFGSIAWVTSWLKSLLVKQQKLNRELSRALDLVRTLEGLLPICAWCRKVRNDQGSWEPIEAYVTNHSDAIWTHSICPECAQKLKDDPGGTGLKAGTPAEAAPKGRSDRNPAGPKG